MKRALRWKGSSRLMLCLRLGILDAAARHGQVDLAQALGKLRKTTLFLWGYRSRTVNSGLA